MKKQEWLDAQVFPEELRQIVRDKKGMWPYAWSDSRLLAKKYTRQQFEQCLAQMTGRPMVEDWGSSAGRSAESIFASRGAWMAISICRSFEWPLTEIKECIGGNSLSLDAATQIEEIMFDGIDLSDHKKTTIKPGESMKEAHARIMNGESISDGDWFRNGAVPPVGAEVFMMPMADIVFRYGRERVGEPGIVAASYVSSYGRNVVVIEYNGAGYCFDADIVWPKGYDLDVIHEQAINSNNALIADLLTDKYGQNTWSDGTRVAAQLMLKRMIDDGCKIIKDK